MDEVIDINWKRTLVILWVSNFAVTAGMSLILPFLPLYIETLGVHQPQALDRWSGSIFAIQFVTSVIFQPIWGAMADRFGRKPMLLRAGIGMGVITTLMGFVTSPFQLLGLRLINGVFSGFISMSVSLQASTTPTEHSGRALGTLQTGAIAGSLLGPLVGGFLSETLGFKGVFYLTGALLILASLIVFVFVHEPKRTERPKSQSNRTRLHALRPLLPVFIASITIQAGMMTIEPIVTLYAKTIYTGPHLAVMAGLVVATSGFANLIGAPTLGRLSDRIGQRRVLIIALIMAMITYIPQAIATNMTVLLIGRALLGLFIGGMIPSLNVLVKKKAPANLQAVAFGINSSSVFLGNLIGPLLGSNVAALYSIRSVFYVTMGMLLLNAIYLYLQRDLDQSPQEDLHTKELPTN
ncbi:MFS transporter [Ferroacidibacillus organovorans]|uniref:MFS transporter n=2 Tax=Ferroacidibacillus organovorans TaxID=1765683 RepID=A0A117SXX2_9BACL|nr:MFS transporter [Ferroacidibacillus organovorans]